VIVFELEVDFEVIGAVQVLYPVDKVVPPAQLTHPAGPVIDDVPDVYVKSNGIYPAEQVYPV